MPALKFVGGTVGIMVLVALFNLLRQWAAKIKNEKLREFVLEVVKAAEKMFGSGTGAAKLAWVEERVAPLGASREIIEAAVKTLDLAEGERSR